MIKISPIVLFVVFSSFNSIANAQDIPLNKNDSIYKYNALENKVNFINGVDNLNEKLQENPENIVLIDENLKKLNDITKQRINSIQESEDAMTTIKNMSAFRTFIIGNKLGILKFQMVQMKNQSYVLKLLALETTDDAINNNINDQIKILKKEQEKVESFILEQNNKFSLFGWLVVSL